MADKEAKESFSTPRKPFSRGFSTPFKSQSTPNSTPNTPTSEEHLESELSKVLEEISSYTDISDKDCGDYVELLHDYNDMRDLGQELLGKLARFEGKTTVELYDEFGLDIEDWYKMWIVWFVVWLNTKIYFITFVPLQLYKLQPLKGQWNNLEKLIF